MYLVRMIIVLSIVCVLLLATVALAVLLWRMNRRPATKPATAESSRSSKSTGGEWKKTGVTFYGQSKADDNGVGFAGVDLFRHGEAGLKFKGKPLFPVAVFQGDAAEVGLWSVLEIRSDGFTNEPSVYGHVVDVCNSGQDVCKTNTAKHGFLVDIHKTAFEYVGADDGLLFGEYRRVGSLDPGAIDADIWLKDGTIACSCTGTCKGNDVKWVPRKKCV